MKTIDISDDSLIDILMMEFPPTLSIDESRERLELEILMAAEEAGEEDYENEESTVAISPAWVFMALLKRRTDWLNKQSPEHISALAKRAMERRKNERT